VVWRVTFTARAQKRTRAIAAPKRRLLVPDESPSCFCLLLRKQDVPKWMAVTHGAAVLIFSHGPNKEEFLLSHRAKKLADARAGYQSQAACSFSITIGEIPRGPPAWILKQPSRLLLL